MIPANRLPLLVSVALGASVALTPVDASAHGEETRERERPAGSTETAGGEPGGEPEEARFSAGIDFVAGWGKTTVADQLPPGSASVNPVNRVASDPITTDSFVIGAGFEITKHLGIGARLPLTTGTISPDGYQSRFISSFGNLEL